jgi:hypothetical protein
MKKLVFLPILLAAVIVLATQCFNKPTAATQKTMAAVEMKQTHQEAKDTLLADSTAPLKPLNFKVLNNVNAMAFLKANNLDSLFIKDYPNNGFYGEDHYRIELVYATKKTRLCTTLAVKTVIKPSLRLSKGRLELRNCRNLATQILIQRKLAVCKSVIYTLPKANLNLKKIRRSNTAAFLKVK